MGKIKQADLPPGVAAITQKGQAVVYTCDPGLFVRTHSPVPAQAVTVRISAPKAPMREVQGQQRPLSRDDLALWYAEARRLVKDDAMPAEWYQVRRTVGCWPEIVRSRSEIEGAERERRNLALAEGRGQTDRAAAPRIIPSAAEIARLNMCCEWTYDVRDQVLRQALRWHLCGASFAEIAAGQGVAKSMAHKRYNRALDDIWQVISTSAPKS